MELTEIRLKYPGKTELTYIWIQKYSIIFCIFKRLIKKKTIP